MTIAAGAAALAIVAWPGAAAWRHPGRVAMEWGIDLVRTPGVSFPRSGRQGRAVRISEGEIPMQQFLQSLADQTGLPVLSQKELEAKTIPIAADIEQADERIVTGILEINGLRVSREELPSGRDIVKVEEIQ